MGKIQRIGFYDNYINEPGFKFNTQSITRIQKRQGNIVERSRSRHCVDDPSGLILILLPLY